MREIKFRGMHNGKWIYGYLVELRVCCSEETKYAIESPEFEPVPVDEKTIGEFAGCRDKNGVEIYDGDIVEKPVERWNGWKLAPTDEKERFLVYREVGRWILYDEKTGKYFSHLTYFDSAELEVVGNIFEVEF